MTKIDAASFKAGVEAAAKWHDDAASLSETEGIKARDRGLKWAAEHWTRSLQFHEACAREIRTLGRKKRGKK